MTDDNSTDIDIDSVFIKPIVDQMNRKPTKELYENDVRAIRLAIDRAKSQNQLDNLLPTNASQRSDALLLQLIESLESVAASYSTPVEQTTDVPTECTSGTRVDCKHNQSDKKSDLGCRVIADSLALFCDSDTDNSADEKSHETLF